MERLEFTPSRTRLVVGAIAGCLLVLLFGAFAAVALLAAPGPTETQGSRLGLFAVCGGVTLLAIWAVVRCLRLLSDRRAVVTLDDEGVEDRSLGIGKLPWAAIEQVRLVQLRRNGVVYSTMMPFKLSDQEARVRELSSGKRKIAGANQAIGYEPFNLNLTLVPLQPETVMAYLNHWRARAGLGPLPLLEW